MSNSQDYITYVLDCLEPLGYVTAKKMFGGHGIFQGSTIFALVADDELYFKVTDLNRAAYEAASSTPFTYYKGNKPYTMSYWRVLEDLLEDEDKLLSWAQQAIQASKQGKTS